MGINMNYRALVAISAIALSAGTAFAASGFLSDYSKLKPVQSQTGTDLVYAVPDAAKRLAVYSSVMVDQPEILFSADSEYRGMKPEDVQAIAAMMREAVQQKLTAGGYSVVEQPGANVIFLRL